MKRIYILPIFYLLLCTACEKEDKYRNMVAFGDEISFTGCTLTETVSRAEVEYTALPTEEDITIIAPGYGTNGKRQEEVYSVGTNELLEPTDGKYIKRSAMNMSFAAWTTPQGLNIVSSAEEGTVDLGKNLDNLIGAYAAEDIEEEHSNNITLEFRHLVAKLSITVYEIKEDVGNQEVTKTKITDAGITFPAIKEMARFTAKLTEYPSVSPGLSGSELTKKTENDGVIQVFLPPLSNDDLLMYGTFSVKVANTDYVGTLSSLSTGAIDAGHHVIMEITIQDDRTALLQAVTLAPWEAYPSSYYNRPYPGIWGMEDLLYLSELINENKEEVNGHTLEDFYTEEDGQKIIRQYTDIMFDVPTEFSPIGTETNPFKDIVFDGNGYHINNLHLDNPDDSNHALFGVVENAIIRNVSLRNFSIEGNNNVGALIGQSLGGLVIDHCYTSGGTVSGIDNVGGLIGINSETDIIRNCSVSLISVSGTNQVGGFIGVNNGTVGNCFTVLSQGLSCVYDNAGGFAGKNHKLIENCYSSAVFSSTPRSNCGAFVGYDEGYADVNATKTYLCYWSSKSIDNGACSKVIGNNTEYDSDNLEILPRSTGEAFDSNGNITNLVNTTVALRERLNNNVNTIGKRDYLKWATVVSYDLPIFSY